MEPPTSGGGAGNGWFLANELSLLGNPDKDARSTLARASCPPPSGSLAHALALGLRMSAANEISAGGSGRGRGFAPAFARQRHTQPEPRAVIRLAVDIKGCAQRLGALAQGVERRRSF